MKNEIKKKIGNKSIHNKKKNRKYSVQLKFDKVDWGKVEKIYDIDKKTILRNWQIHKNLSPRTKDILKLLAGGAIIGLSFVFPTLPMAIAPFIIDSNKYNRRDINHILTRLNRQKLVEIIEENGNTVVKITEEGRVRALRYKLYEMEVKRPKAWDGKWRMVIFDIPEKFKRMREIFRQHLKIMGFYPLQKSVWVHPFPCFDEVEFLRQIYHVGISVTYVVAEKIEGSEDIKSRFDL